MAIPAILLTIEITWSGVENHKLKKENGQVSQDLTTVSRAIKKCNLLFIFSCRIFLQKQAVLTVHQEPLKAFKLYLNPIIENSEGVLENRNTK